MSLKNNRHFNVTSLALLLTCLLAFTSLSRSYSSLTTFVANQGGLSAAIASLDSRAFITAADLMTSKDIDKLYDLRVQFAAQQQRFPSLHSFSDTLIFINPPFVAVVLSPLASLETDTAYLVLILCNTILLLVCLFLIYRLVHHVTFSIQLVSVVGFASFPPLSITIFQTQFSLIVLTALLAAWLCLKRGELFYAGLCLSLLTVKPHLLLLPFVALLAMGRVRPILGLFAGLSLLIFIGLAGVGLVGWNSWFALVLDLLQQEVTTFGIHPDGMYTLKSLLHLLLGSEHSLTIRTLWYFSLATAIAVVALTFFRQHNWRDDTSGLKWGGMTAATLLFSPHANIHDLLLLIIPCLALAVAANEATPSFQVAAAVVGFLCWLSPFVGGAPSLATVPVIIVAIVTTLLLHRHLMQARCLTNRIES